MIFLVTGASGLLGSQVVRDLKAEGHEVVALSRKQRRDVPADTWIEADLVDVDWDAVMPQVDGIAAIAGSLDMRSSVEAWQSCLDVNVIGLKRLVDFAIGRKIERFVFTSSAGLYRRPARHLPISETDEILPLRPYWTSKLFAEQLLQSDEVRSKLKPWILRLSSPYGPESATRSVLPIFVDRAKKGESLTIKGEGRRSQDFVSVWDASSAHVKCLTTEAISSSPMNLGGGQEISMLELATTINQVFENQAETPLLRDAADGSDDDRFVLDISALRGAIGHSPMPLLNGLERMREEMLQV